MVLYFIGIGLNDEKDITINGLEAVKKSKYVYLESYTSILQVSKEDLEKVKETAQNILNHKEKSRDYLYKLSVEFRGSKAMCDLHKKLDSSVETDCQICSE